jgi:hypothetical protein
MRGQEDKKKDYAPFRMEPFKCSRLAPIWRSVAGEHDHGYSWQNYAEIFFLSLTGLATWFALKPNAGLNNNSERK